MARSTGRPRAAGTSPTGRGTREDILHAGAVLFCTEGYGSTSTHTLAKAAGIRQASLYHYFSGKHEVLLTLLLGTVQPSLDVARILLARQEMPAVRLWALCAADVRILSAGDVNVGSLYLLPELNDDRFAPFHRLRGELEGTYLDLVSGCGAPEDDAQDAARLVLGLVESVILQRRREPGSITDATSGSIADAALRVVDVGDAALREARRRGPQVLRELAALGAIEAPTI